MPKRAKALTNFYSQEFGSVSVGDELQIANQSTMTELTNAGYIQEIGEVHDGSIAAHNDTAMNHSATAKAVSKARAKKGAADVEFAADEMGAANTPNQMGKAVKQAQAQAKANAMHNTVADTEFAADMGATSTDVANAKAQAQANAQAKANQQMSEHE